MSTQSFRWLTNDQMDVDAYLCEGQSWYLFLIAKSAEAAVRQKTLASEFEEKGLGKVLAVGGALKTKTGSEPLQTVWFAAPSETLWAKENGLWFRLETKEVLNPGLFLDQTSNRTQLIEHLKEMEKPQFRFLNLFSYSGAFSVAAVKAGVHETISIDVSRRYLNWEKANHEKNESIAVSTCQHKYFPDDARIYLERAKKKGQSFDAIVLDPPTFSKSAGKVFEVQKHFFPMAENCISILAEGGVLLASLNDHRFTEAEFLRNLRGLSKGKGLEVQPGKTAPGFSKDHGLKSAWIF